MTKFLVLIYGNEQVWADASEEWNEENGRRHRAFLEAAGSAVLSGGELVPPRAAISVRGDAPGQEVSSGPFVTADAGIGGFYLIEAQDAHAALDLARGIPEASAPGSGVEVREMVGPG